MFNGNKMEMKTSNNKVKVVKSKWRFCYIPGEIDQID